MASNPRGNAQRPRTIRIELSLRSVFTLLAIAIGLWLLVQIWQILLLFVIAVVIAGTFSPVVDGLEKRGMRRSVTLGLILLGLTGVIAGLGFLVVPALASLLEVFAARLPEMQRQVADALAPIRPLSGVARSIREATPDHYVELLGASPLAAVGATTEVLVYGVTTVVLAFYILSDRERIQGFLYALVPRRYHVRTARILLDMETVVGGYVRGQALTSLLMAAFIFTLLSVIGAPNALALAVLAAFFDLLPFVGGILVLTPTVLAASSVGVAPAGIVFVATLIYQEVETRIIVPRVYGQTLRLSPVAVTLALLIGGKLLGIVGALLALPIAAGIRVVVEDMRIELPGEQPGEETQRKLDAKAEMIYAEQSEGATAVESAVIASALAEQMQQEEGAVAGRIDVDVEEQRAASAPDSTPAK